MRQWSKAVLLLLAGAVLGTMLSQSILQGQFTTPQIPPEKTSYRDVVKKILPAVVSIQAKGMEKADPNEPPPPARPGFGSGVLVDPKGIILTNHHVVRGAKKALVQLANGQRYVTREIKSDPKTDLAILVIRSENPFPYLELGQSEAMAIGDRVLAIGAPFGLIGSVTSGIVSGKGRSLRMNVYEDFLQTDAAINPGNSGGPLVNLEGKVIGINSAIKSKTGAFQGVGLAISTQLIRSVMPQLLEKGKVQRGYLGAQVKSLTDRALAKALGMKDNEKGLLVTRTVPKSPVSKAGIKEGDILLNLAGKPIGTSRDLQFAVVSLPLGKPVEVTLLRNGEHYSSKVTIEEQPSKYGDERVKVPLAPRVDRSVTVEGLAIKAMDMSHSLAQRLGYGRDLNGALITGITENGISEEVLREGLVITHVNRSAIRTVKDLENAIAKGSLEEGVLLQVYAPQSGLNYVLIKKR